MVLLPHSEDGHTEAEKSGVGMVVQLVRNPARFMDRKVGQPTIHWEVVTVLLVGAIGSVGLAYVGQQTLSSYDASELLRFPVMGLVVRPIAGMVVLWVGYSIGIHLLANRVYNARGPVARVLKPTAWALVPMGLANLVRTAVMYLIVQDVDIRAVLEQGDLFGLLDPITLVMDAIMDRPLYLLAPLATVVAIIASGYLLVYATQSAKDLPREEAIRTVAVLVGIHLAYVVWTVSQMVGIP